MIFSQGASATQGTSYDATLTGIRAEVLAVCGGYVTSLASHDISMSFARPALGWRVHVDQPPRHEVCEADDELVITSQQ